MSTKTSEKTVRPVRVMLYRWAGKWGPFKVKIPCGECALTKDVLLDTFETDLAGIPIELDVRDWLTGWYKPLLKGGWHAPIVFVEDKIISQGYPLNRGVLTEAIIGSTSGDRHSMARICSVKKAARTVFARSRIWMPRVLPTTIMMS